MYSIRRRLIGVIIGGVAFVLTVTGIILDTMINAEIQNLFDDTIRDEALSLVTLTDQEDGRVFFELIDELKPEFSAGDKPEYFELRLGDGPVIRRSQSLGNADLPRFDTPLGEHTFHDVTLPNGRAARLIEVRFVPHHEITRDSRAMPGSMIAPQPAGVAANEPEVNLVYAREIQDVEQLRFAVRAIIVSTMFIVLAAIAILVGKHIRTGLLPLQRLAAQVQTIDESALDTSIETSASQSVELAPIEQQLNKLLIRLRDAFSREKRFSADVAHELRTPLAELKTLAEVAGRVRDDHATLQAFFDDVHGIAEQMEGIVTNLLDLSRLDAGMVHTSWSTFRLAPLLDRVWSGIIAERPDNKRFGSQIPGDILVASDYEKLEIILRNLLINAQAHSPPGITITAGVRGHANSIDLWISNPAPALDHSDLAQMRQRFWRKDEARTTTLHQGLGLSLVDALATLLTLNLALSLDYAGIFTATLRGLERVTVPELPGNEVRL